jgi:hypothetical protein
MPACRHTQKDFPCQKGKFLNNIACSLHDFGQQSKNSADVSGCIIVVLEIPIVLATAEARRMGGRGGRVFAAGAGTRDMS